MGRTIKYIILAMAIIAIACNLFIVFAPGNIETIIVVRNIALSIVPLLGLVGQRRYSHHVAGIALLAFLPFGQWTKDHYWQVGPYLNTLGWFGVLFSAVLMLFTVQSLENKKAGIVNILVCFILFTQFITLYFNEIDNYYLNFSYLVLAALTGFVLILKRTYHEIEKSMLVFFLIYSLCKSVLMLGLFM